VFYFNAPFDTHYLIELYEHERDIQRI